MQVNIKQISTFFLLLCLPLSWAWAQPIYLSGRVLKLDKSAGTMTLGLFRPGHHGGMMAHGNHRHMLSSREIDVLLESKNFPDSIKSGEIIRIRGRFDDMHSGLFIATDVIPFKGMDNDPTGVRSRLMHHQ